MVHCAKEQKTVHRISVFLRNEYAPQRQKKVHNQAIVSQSVNVDIFMAENPKMKRRRKIGQVDSEEPARRTEVKVEMGRVKIDHSGGGMSGNVMILRGGS